MLAMHDITDDAETSFGLMVMATLLQALILGSICVLTTNQQPENGKQHAL